MPRSGTGTYVLPAGNPVVTGTTISSTWANNSLSDIATALTQSLAKDGQTTPTANIPLGGFKITGLGAPTTAGDALAYGSSLGSITAPNLMGGAFAGLRNRVTNGNFYNDQRNSGASQTITAAAALAYTVDRFYAYCTGANVTGQRVAGTAPNAYLYRFTGAASVTKIGFAQRIENLNCQDLAGSTATLSVDLSNSLLTTVTWTAWYANTANTFGSLASPTRTLISTGTFTVTSTLTRYNTNITIPSAATTGIEIELSVGAQISGTWNIGNVQLEFGSVATPFEQRPIGMELALCQRYAALMPGFSSGFAYSTTAAVIPIVLSVPLRGTPTLSTGVYQIYNSSGGAINCATNPVISIQGNVVRIDPTVASGLVAGNGTTLASPSGSILSAEL
jgi:hypothetical protein